MFSNDMKSAVMKAADVCEAVAEGDFEARIINITETGDAGRMLHAINRMIDRSDAYVRESKASLQYVANNKYFRRISEKGMSGAFAEASHVVNEAMGSMEERVEEFTRVVQAFEEQMKEVVESVAAAATELEASAQTMNGAATSASEQSTAVAAAAEEASANVGSVAAATEQLTKSVGEINRQVAGSSKATAEAVEEVGRTSSDISGLNNASEKIGEVVSLITDIADQTNLLALNATIEAARAGESGKGFAVVASEVKNLANQTAKATEEISRQITGIQDASSKAAKSMEAISMTISNVDEISSTIATAVEQQGAATEEIARNIEQASTGTAEVSSSITVISQAVGETDTAATEVLSASSELAQKGELMRTEVDNFLQEVRKVV